MEREKTLTAHSTQEFSEVPTIDLNHLGHNSRTRSIALDELRQACKHFGFFQITNHGISESVIEEALDSSSKFFNLPIEEKNVFSSEDVYKPVRFVAIPNGGADLSREFIKIYAHPIKDWIDSWPPKPADYREKVGKYATEVRSLSINIMGTIMESLGLSPNHLRESIDQGMQIIAINNYPQCISYSSSFSSSTVKTVGISSHTDHSIITILIESTPGLEVFDSRDDTWKLVLVGTGTRTRTSTITKEYGIIVLVGNHLEVLSNGVYKSVVHRVVRSSFSGRISIGSFHSLPMEEKVEPALELVEKEQHTKRYTASSLSDFIKYLSIREAKPYIESLKI